MALLFKAGFQILQEVWVECAYKHESKIVAFICCNLVTVVTLSFNLNAYSHRNAFDASHNHRLEQPNCKSVA